MDEIKKTIEQINSTLFRLGTTHTEIMKEAELNNVSEDFKREVTFYLYLTTKSFKDADFITKIKSELTNDQNEGAQYTLKKINEVCRLNTSIQKYKRQIHSINLKTFIDKNIIKYLEAKRIYSSALIGQNFSEKSTNNSINYFYTIKPLNNLNKYVCENYAVLPIFDESEIKTNIQSHLIDFIDKRPYIQKLGVIQKKQTPPLRIFEKLPTRRIFKPSSYVLY